jgi:adenosine deaminase
VILLVPNSKKDEIEWNRDKIYYFLDFDLDNLVTSFGHNQSDIDRIEDKENGVIIRYFVVDEIRELYNIFPLDDIDEFLEEYYEITEDLPDFDDRRSVERWVIAVKVSEEVERLKGQIEKEMIERLSFFKGCIFAEVISGSREKAKELIKQKFQDYEIISD